MASSMPAFHECESNLDLGFVEDTPGWLLASRFFPSKVGGRPSWLDLKNVPSTEELSCDKCTRVLTFLLQIYAPIESDPNCFHRQVLVFMCLNVACHQFKVFRCQLPRHNEFFPSEAPVESQTWKPELNISKYTTVCRACGCPGSKKCSGCQKVSYCSREHQMADWKLRHKAECKNPDFAYEFKEDADQVEGITLPQFEIIMTGDDEQVSDSDDDEQVDQAKEMAKLEQLNAVEISLKDLQDFPEEGQNLDKNFKRFQKVVKCAPDQVIRYQRSSTPLWISEENKAESIPNCEHCSSPRVFEFQIMPQLLSKLKLDKGLNEQSIDWGILAVYTCEKSCRSDNKSYTQEFIWKQMIQ